MMDEIAQEKLQLRRLTVEGAIPCPVKAGDMLLFSAELWHHSKENFTDQIRRAFIVSYQEATVPRGNGNQWKILRPKNGQKAPK